jgi:N-acetylglucosamine kinase-like BadF-type ATPase
MGENGTRPPASTIEALDAHLYHLQNSINALVASVAEMATREDVASLGRRLDDFATKGELSALEKRLTDGAPGKSFDRFLSFVTRVGAAGVVIVALVGGIVALVRFVDHLPK